MSRLRYGDLQVLAHPFLAQVLLATAGYDEETGLEEVLRALDYLAEVLTEDTEFSEEEFCGFFDVAAVRVKMVEDFGRSLIKGLREPKSAELREFLQSCILKPFSNIEPELSESLMDLITGGEILNQGSSPSDFDRVIQWTCENVPAFREYLNAQSPDNRREVAEQLTTLVFQCTSIWSCSEAELDIRVFVMLTLGDVDDNTSPEMTT